MTETDIANLALSHLGEPRIAAISESSKVAIACRTHYETVRDSLLRAHNWNFAMKQAELSLIGTPLFGPDYEFALPSDFLRLSTFNGFEAALSEGNYIIEGASLLTDEATARITYVHRLTDPTQFDANFVELLSHRLAAAIAMAVSKSSSKRDAMAALAMKKGKKAAFVDAGENRARVLSPLQSRYNPRTGTYT